MDEYSKAISFNEHAINIREFSLLSNVPLLQLHRYDLATEKKKL
jgi:hypothetical protein